VFLYNEFPQRIWNCHEIETIMVVEICSTFVDGMTVEGWRAREETRLWLECEHAILPCQIKQAVKNMPPRATPSSSTS
jgi:hypothetical protein